MDFVADENIDIQNDETMREMILTIKKSLVIFQWII